MTKPACVSITCMLILALGAGSAFAQGRGGGRSAGGPPSSRGPSVERLSRPDAAAARAPVARSRPATVAETPEHAAAPEKTGGRLDGLRRFFGFERSQERMNDEGLAHQKATDQERGPRTGE